jgi:RHH-type transcriptional regulator, rel operon repressor / antitoxin RelB
MLAVRIKPDVEKRLSHLADTTGRTKSYYVQKALEEFLADEEDYLIALERLHDNRGTVSFSDVINALGINKNELAG